jgi:hypothetical protein
MAALAAEGEHAPKLPQLKARTIVAMLSARLKPRPFKAGTDSECPAFQVAQAQLAKLNAAAFSQLKSRAFQR